MKVSFVYAIILVLSLMIISCEDDPTSVGSDLLPPGDLVQFDELDSYTDNIPQVSSSFIDKIYLGNADEMLVGKADGIKATALLRFFIPITVETGRLIDSSNITIVSAKVILPQNYVYGDEAAYFGMDVHAINSFWSSDSFDVDSLNILDYDFTPMVPSGEISYSDTLISFFIDTDMVLDWMKAELDTNLTDANGFLLKPHESSEKILGFKAFGGTEQDYQPTIEIAYSSSEFENEFDDTLTATIVSDLHVLEGTPDVAEEGQMVFRGGFGTRGGLKFDLSNIPQNSIINNAQLEIQYDSLSSKYGSRRVDSLRVFLMDDFETHTSFDSLGYFYLQKDGDMFTGTVTRFVQRWLYDESNNGVSNNGFKITLADELEYISKVVLYNSEAADPMLRPRLKIIYSRK